MLWCFTGSVLTAAVQLRCGRGIATTPVASHSIDRWWNFINSMQHLCVSMGAGLCNHLVTGSNSGHGAVECNPWQVVFTCAFFSKQCNCYYWPMGTDAIQLGR